MTVRRIVPAVMVAVMLLLTGGPMRAHGQEACGFVGGFAELRGLVGEQRVGACLENEHYNLENGNAEQRTTGGLLVWRKVDNFTAFTDGGTTWINGPNGLQSRPNHERLAWERDPVVPTGAQPAATPRPLPTPPAAMTGMPTASSTESSSGIIPMPPFARPPASIERATTRSQPSSCAARASSAEITWRHARPPPP